MEEVGRPTKYNPKYCDMLIKHMSKGHSFQSFGAEIDVARSTIYKWLEEFEEFSDARKRAVDKSLKFMEGVFLEGMWNEKTADGNGKTIQSKILNSPAAIFYMKNVHGWRDKPEEHKEDEFPEKKSVSTKSNEELDSILESEND